MKRKVVLPKISKCPDAASWSLWRLEGRMLEFAYGFIVVGVLALAHIHLQFMQADVALQHSELQKTYRILRHEEQKQVLNYEAMCDPARLAAVAKAADLRAIDVRSQRVALVSAQVRDKYQVPVAAIYPQPVLNTSVASAEGLTGLLLGFLDGGSAYAASDSD